MDEATARLALAPVSVPATGGMTLFTDQWAAWPVRDGKASLSGAFTADQLEALAWWMRNMGKK